MREGLHGNQNKQIGRKRERVVLNLVFAILMALPLNSLNISAQQAVTVLVVKAFSST